MMHGLTPSALIAARFGAAVARIVAGDMTAVDLIGAAEGMREDLRLAQELYQLWIRHNESDPLLHAVLFNNGVVLGQLNDLQGSIENFHQAIRRQPDFLPPYINLGTALERQGQRAAAVATWQMVTNRLGAVTPDGIAHKAGVLKQIGRVFEEARAFDLAEAHLRQSLEIDSRQVDVMQHWTSLRQVQCRWPIIHPIGDLDGPSVKRAMSPLSLAAYTDDPMFQLAHNHRNHVRDRAQIQGPITVGGWVPPESEQPGRPLRIGYLSPDLREHAIGFLTGDIYRLHDRTKVTVHAYYSGPDLPDAHQAGIRSTVDHWTDLKGLTDKHAAAAIVRDGIDILVDLGGYTKDSRNKLFALRPAPIIVNWLGFPGSMGSPDHHYIIADPVIIPPEHERYFSERVVRLPCYQPNDRNRAIADPPSRAEAGLPDGAFVFCCFNGSQKFSPFTFARWMRILQGVPNAVLWLLSSGESTDVRLRDHAASHGVAPERLVFAGRQRNPEHMARYKLADLFLDTSPYGAHTTASDAMWMGVPVVTLAGRAFASRVCTSLVSAAGLGDLVAHSSEEYVSLAIELGTNKERLAELRARLAAERETCTLFDTPRLVTHLESLYRGMWQDFITGHLPRPDLTNLELYSDIGSQCDHDAVETLDEAAYRARYVNAMAYRQALAVRSKDNRLWSAAS